MLQTEEKWALICYAGSAPQASTGSKPIGSELDRVDNPNIPTCQQESPLTLRQFAVDSVVNRDLVGSHIRTLADQTNVYSSEGAAS